MKAVLITLVVVGHLLEPVAVTGRSFLMGAVDFIYLFHMPLFIFVTGLFCKGVYRDGKFRAATIINYLALCWVLYFALRAWRMVLVGEPVPIDPMTLSGGSIPWYLMVTAIYATMTPLFSRLKPSFAIVAAVLLAVVSGAYKSTDLLTLSRVVVFAPFFLAGYYLKPSSFESFFDGLSFSKLLSLRLVAVVVLVGVFVFFQIMDENVLVFLKKLFTGRNSYETIVESSGFDAATWECCMVRIGYYLAVAVVSACVLSLTPRRNVFVLTKVGEHSLHVYFFHPFVYYALNSISFGAGLFVALPAYAATAVLVVLSALVTIVLGAPNFPHVFFDGVKKLAEKACL